MGHSPATLSTSVDLLARGHMEYVRMTEAGDSPISGYGMHPRPTQDAHGRAGRWSVTPF